MLPFGNDKLLKIGDKFKYNQNDLINFHKIFRKMDKIGSGYINLDNMYTFLDEELSSMISPYIERFFLLILKENKEKITFIE